MKYKINNLILELNSICNNNCIYCYLKKRKDTGANSFNFFKNKIIEFSKKEVKEIDFTGGEPTLYDNLEKLVYLSKKYQFKKINLITNGKKLSDLKYCKKLIFSGINCFVITVDGHNSEICESITRSIDSFEMVMKAFDNLNKLKFNYGATIVVTKKNYRYISDMLNLCIEKNVKFVNIQYMLPYINDKHIDCRKIPSNIIPSYNETINYVKFALDKFKNKVEIKIHFIPFCYFEGYEKHLFKEANKLDRWALNYRGFDYNIGKHLLKDTIKIDKCFNCKYNNICIGFFKSYSDELGTKNEILINDKMVKNNYKNAYNINKTKTLFFKNLFVSSEGKENNDWFHQATFYLASTFSKNNLQFVISNFKFNNGNFEKNELEKLLLENPNINIIVISLIENCFEQAKELIDFLRKKTKAFIIFGGIMQTFSPYHVMEHLKNVDFVVKGEGEKILLEIQKILNGFFTTDILNSEIINKLKKLKGIIFRINNKIITSDDFSNNLIDDLDSLKLDFNLLTKQNVENGLNLSTSRGCYNNCYFCTILNRGSFRAMSFNKLKSIINDYYLRLIKLYGQEKNIPKNCFKLSFNDDDFLGDKDRAINFFKYIKQSKFKIDFIQTSIRSFFIKKNKKITDSIDLNLIKYLSDNIFCSNINYQIYIGTENFCNNELNKLGKNYDYEKIEKVIEKLSKNKIIQAHHLILTNIETTLDNILENLIKINVLKIKYGKYFNILIPIIPNLVSFYPSNSYNLFFKKYNNDFFNIHQFLKSNNNENLNYPLILNDIPKDVDVKLLSEKSNFIFRNNQNYLVFLEKTLIYLLNTLEKLKIKNEELKRIKKLERIIDKYRNFHKLIKQNLPLQKSKNFFKNTKNNVQIMLTRRCQLRCKYCPIPKKDSDMDEKILKKTIDKLFLLKQNNIRIDFTGGEPLLKFNLLKKAINYAIKKSKLFNKKVSFYIVTNALLLDKKVINFLNNKDVLLELSIDGNEKTHNEFKIPLETINPYQITTNNIKELKNKNINHFIVIVATLKTVKNLFNNFEHILNLGYKKFEINYAIGTFWDNKHIKIFLQQINKIILKYFLEIKKGKIEIGNLFKRSEPAVLNSEFMIDTNGDIRFLNEFLFKSENINKCPYELPNIMDCNFNELYVDKFMVYYSLISMYSADVNVRKVLDNNIKMGVIVKKHIFKIKNKLGCINENRC